VFGCKGIRAKAMDAGPALAENSQQNLKISWILANHLKNE